MGDIVHIGDGGESDLWRRMDGESQGEYVLFEEYIRHGDVRRVSEDTGISLSRVKRCYKVWDWENRRNALLASGRSILSSPGFFDGVVYEQAAQIAAEKLLELGITTLQLRDPSMIPAELAQSMIRDAVGILKGRDAADVTIKISKEESLQVIDAIVDEIIGGEDEPD